MEPTQAPVWDDGEDEYYNCPIKFLSDATVDFCSEYWYYKAFGAAPGYKAVPARFADAALYYESKLEEFAAVARENKKREKDGLRDLRVGFEMRKHAR